LLPDLKWFIFSAIAALAGSVSAQNAWQIIAPNLATEITGVTFNADAKTGYVAGGANGVGAEVLKTVDGGNTWASTSDAFDLLPLDVTSYGNYVVSSGALITLTSTDGGNTFVDADCNACVGQCVRNIGPQANPIGIGLTGQFGDIFGVEGNGLAVSMNGGLNFTQYFNITQLQTGARYSSHPSANTWYITAGQWPGEGSDDQPSDQTTTGTGTGSTTTGGGGSTTTGGSGSTARVAGARSHRLTERLSVYRDDKGRIRHQFHTSSRSRSVGRSAQASGYMAQIAKTTDAGQTWTISYTSNNQFYFNGIDCDTETNCCAAAEADDGAYAGAYIYCTFDGTNWQQMYSQTNYTGASLLDVRTVGNGGYWAVGGIIDGAPEAAAFLYSSNGGRNWTVASTIPSQYTTSVDCSVATQDCWATVIDAEQTGSVASNVAA
jgi:photosystem II stability/assembly factor-like uncharacterized protein